MILKLNTALKKRAEQTDAPFWIWNLIKAHSPFPTDSERLY